MKRIMVGGVAIGGGAPVSVQSMTNTDTRDAEATLLQIGALREAGCAIVRVAVPDEQAALAMPSICARSHLPVVADIHFDYRLAVASAEAGAAKIRVNPGNIEREDKLREIVAACRAHAIPIRIGVNSGSVSPKLLSSMRLEDAMLESALRQIDMLDKLGFHDICLSLKATTAPMTIRVYRAARERLDIPLHVGVTEAGTETSGLIRSSVGIGSLLCDGIGDTIRVSLTADPVREVHAGKAILRACGLLHDRAQVVSCPTCGRCHMDVIGLAGRVERALESVSKPLTVAVMGCEVNGPGEARAADIGIAGGKTGAVIFCNGEIVERVSAQDAFDALMRRVMSL